jgi:hypothetical protein
MNIAEFWDLLARHDWTYQMSDDHRAWTRGSDQAEQIQHIVKNSPPEFKELRVAFSDWAWGRSGKKPTRPE